MADKKAAQKTKGNPASKRMTNDKLKARRTRSWLAGERKKADNRTEQNERATANRELRAAGLPTPWEVARAARRRRRAERAAQRKRAA